VRLIPTMNSAVILNLVGHGGWRRGVLVLLVLEHGRLRHGHDLLLLELALDLRGEATRIRLGQNGESLALCDRKKTCRNNEVKK
jgi:hypothetical protein